jgi:hypothetical protein
VVDLLFQFSFCVFVILWQFLFFLFCDFVPARRFVWRDFVAAFVFAFFVPPQAGYDFGDLVTWWLICFFNFPFVCL